MVDGGLATVTPCGEADDGAQPTPNRQILQNGIQGVFPPISDDEIDDYLQSARDDGAADDENTILGWMIGEKMNEGGTPFGPPPADPGPEEAPPDPYPGLTLAADFLAGLAAYFFVSGKQTVLGDATTEQNGVGTAGQIGVGMLPVVGDLADARDAAADATRLALNPNDPDAQRNAAIQVVAAGIPFVGGKLLKKLGEWLRGFSGKGAKEGAEALGDAGKGAIKEGGQQAAQSGPKAADIAPQALPTKPQHPDAGIRPRSPLSQPISPETPPGTYVFAQDAQGVVHVVPDGPHLHPTVLGNGQEAAASGEIVIGPDGVVTEINNISFTFQHDASVLQGVKAALERMGIKVDPDAIKPFDF
jgi:hypothetical protein